MGQRIDNERVAWIPPEVKMDLLGDRAASDSPYVGEYRLVEDDGSFGALVVWVDDAPEDPQDGDGHFEVWIEDQPYAPTRKAE